jgi:hypothetical protein
MLERGLKWIERSLRVFARGEESPDSAGQGGR